MLTELQLEQVCLAYCGSSKCCRYLHADEDDSAKFVCVKLKKSEKKKIDQKIDSFVSDSVHHGVDPNSRPDSMPMGDNCPGYLLLRYVEQGFDKD